MARFPFAGAGVVRLARSALTAGSVADPIYRVLADGVVVVHTAFIVFAAVGGLLALRWPRVALLQIPAAVWGVLVELNGWPCPLTPLEYRLRALGGGSVSGGDFVGRYLLPIIYPESLTPTIQIVLGILVVGLNIVAYAFVLGTRRRRR